MSLEEAAEVAVHDAPEAEPIDVGLRAALDGLDERERQVIGARYVLGQTYEEAARTLGLPLGTYKRSLRNGLAALRDALLKDADFL